VHTPVLQKKKKKREKKLWLWEVVCPKVKRAMKPGCWWLMPVILATQEAEIRRTVQSQPKQIVRETLSRKYSSPKKKKAGGVAQGVGPEFKPQYHKKIKK
jgi:hypothetical protein